MICVAFGRRLGRKGWMALQASYLCAVGLFFASGCAEAVRVQKGGKCAIEGQTEPAEDGCNSCVCEGGTWACTAKDCPDSCEEGETKQVSCNTCSCSGGEWHCTRKACLPDTCEDGETQPSDDGCNTCTCMEGGWACTQKACLPEVCDEGEKKESADGCGGCVCTDGKWYCDTSPCPMSPACKEGDTKEDGCNSCSCDANGQWLCTAIACPDLCHDGDTKISEDGCNTCTCSAGVWACTERACTSPACMEGSTSGLCNECFCTNGVWACTDVACEPPHECSPGDTKDDGCNTCSCNENGQWQCTLVECGVVCGGLGGVIDCGDDQYCAYQAGEGGCGIADASSVCKLRPEACPTVDEPVCACSGKTYSNACEAARDGWGVMSSGACELSP